MKGATSSADAGRREGGAARTRRRRRRLAAGAILPSLLALYRLAASAGLAAAPPKTLPAGTLLALRLDTPVSTKVSRLHSDVKARVVREVPGAEKIAVPLGAVLFGRIEKLIPSSSPTDRARLLLKFARLEIPGQSPHPVAGHVKEIENARETVLEDGTIQGVLASELPLAHLEGALGKLGDGGDLQKVAEKNLGKSDTSIEYPAGTDFEWVLDQPLETEGELESTVASVLPDSTAAAAAQLLTQAPLRASGKNNAPGDPLNLLVMGNAAEIRKAFEAAGWSEAAQQTGKSIFETVRAVMGEKGYGAAPVSNLYLYGRAEDLAFEKMLNTFTKRHHLRLWRSPATTPDGREIWLGAATHDTALDVRPGVVSHAIDPDLDAERAKVGADLAASGRVAVETLLTRPDPITQGLTATGAAWKTDGKLLAIEFKSE